MVSDEYAANATLAKNNMPSEYVVVAEAFQNNSAEADKFLEKIQEMQDLSIPNDSPYPFVCIFDSSGTGKTQFAATTAVLRRDSKVLYFYVGDSNPESAQEFYKPHIGLWLQLEPLLGDFCRMVEGSARLTSCMACIACLPALSAVSIHEEPI